jgi:hypothetical protein
MGNEFQPKELIVLFFHLLVLGGLVDEASLVVGEVDEQNDRNGLADAKVTLQVVVQFRSSGDFQELFKHQSCCSTGGVEDKLLFCFI